MATTYYTTLDPTTHKPDSVFRTVEDANGLTTEYLDKQGAWIEDADLMSGVLGQEWGTRKVTLTEAMRVADDLGLQPPA